MTDHVQPAPVEQERKRGVRLSPKQVVGLVVLVLAVVFAVQNTAQTEVRFFGGEFEAPLWVLFLGLLLIGVLIGAALTFVRRRD
ncbi:hypothetical protein GCM10023340_09930 [Nocardioides marinquilinus]|uniref:Lipopolysaccharide assembly protein A domain-containing protein n=1 Tax=Nocardioides marinquilinus TaxID=1210400 RepID=A0ABP9PHL2_9ACTN